MRFIALSALLVWVGLTPMLSRADEIETGKPEHKQTGKSKFLEECNATMKEIAKIENEMREMDRRLAEKAEKMNASGGGAKIEEIVNLLNELVAQLKTRQEKLIEMQEKLMRHMMEYMAANAPRASDKQREERPQQNDSQRKRDN